MKKLLFFSTLTIALAAGSVYAQDKGAKDTVVTGTAKSITLPDIATPLKDGPGKEYVEGNCNVCHSTDYINMQPKMPRAKWSATVKKMVKTFGCPVNEAEMKAIEDYLAANYGTGS